MCLYTESFITHALVLIHYYYFGFTVLFQIFLGPVCIPGNALNFTMSTNFTASGETACLACLFDGISPQSGTVWLVNGENIKTSSPFLQVNSNGALFIRQQRIIFSGVIQLSCRGLRITFIITVTLMCKSCIQFYTCSLELLIPRSSA